MELRLFFVLMFLISTASAFPLTGGNGIVEATVYGVSEVGDHLCVDMSIIGVVDNNINWVIDLIDSEDVAFRARPWDFSRTHSYNGFIRNTAVFVVPVDTDIKRLKITPSTSDPFFIDWVGVPEASGSDILMRFYGAKECGYDGDGSDPIIYKKEWTFDVKLTNTGNTTLPFCLHDFAMKDKTGWVYKPGWVYRPSGAYSPYEFTKLLPGESLRFPVTFTYVGAFSSPSELLFRDVTMNIESWV